MKLLHTFNPHPRGNTISPRSIGLEYIFPSSSRVCSFKLIDIFEVTSLNPASLPKPGDIPLRNQGKPQQIEPQDVSPLLQTQTNAIHVDLLHSLAADSSQNQGATLVKGSLDPSPNHNQGQGQHSSAFCHFNCYSHGSRGWRKCTGYWIVYFRRGREVVRSAEWLRLRN